MAIPLSAHLPNALRRWLLAISGWCALAVLIRVTGWWHWPALPELLFVAYTAVVAYRAAWRAGLAVAALSALLLLAGFVPHPWPVFALASQRWWEAVALLVVAGGIGGMVSRLRYRIHQAHQRERRAQTLQQLATGLAAVDDEAGVLALAAPVLHELSGNGPAHWVVPAATNGSDLRWAGPGDPPVLARDALLHVLRSGEAVGAASLRWCDLPAWVLPWRAGAEVLGAVWLESPLADDLAARQHAQALCDLLGAGLLRVRHAAQARTAQQAADGQALKNALLAAVSHDFRTPLASMVGAVSSLINQHDRLKESDRLALLTLLQQEAQYLVGLTDNTLQWARLSGQAHAINADWESVEELAGAVLARVRQRDPDRRIRLALPPDLPLIWGDAGLLSQLLENLLDNALKYTAGPVDVGADVHGGMLHLAVKDRGPGLDDAERQTLFDTFARGHSARGVRGAGLGLAVCRAIALAHQGQLVARRRSGGGSSFVLSLPLKTPPTAQAPALETLT